MVIAAAGSGSRMAHEINKPYLLLAGKAVINYSLSIFMEVPEIKQVVISARPEEIQYCRQIIASSIKSGKEVSVIAGGEERQDSVYQGLQALGKDIFLVVVHDGARPLFTPELLYSLMEAAEQHGAAIPGVIPKDTLKKVECGYVAETLDRSRIVAVQTPQVFAKNPLLKAYAKAYEAGFYATDDAALYEKYMGRVKVVPGDYRNIKITTPEDLVSAALFLQERQQKSQP